VFWVFIITYFSISVIFFACAVLANYGILH
jgi:hypothetical protein